MREIKFRGKREDNGDWVFGSFIPDALEGRNSDLVSWGFIRRYNRGIGKMETIEVGRETVGQFTGLYDKNGTPIYEGDIVLCKIHDKEYMGLVEYTNTYGFYYLSGMGRSDTELWGCNEKKVIGNIHDKVGDE